MDRAHIHRQTMHHSAQATWLALIGRAGAARSVGALAWAAMTLIGAGRLDADVVSVQGRPIAVDVKITALRDGQLTYRTAAGQEISRPIEQVRYLQIAGWDSFNRAERQRREARNAPALESYQKSLSEANAPKGDEPFDRRLLVLCRLVEFHDAQGRFEAAVETYLEILERMPACVDSLRPREVPGNAPEVLRRTAARVDEAVARRDRLDPVGDSLQKWRAGWPDVPPPATSPECSNPGLLVPAHGPATRPADASATPLVAEVRSDVSAGRFEQGIEKVETAKRGSPVLLPPEAYYYLGRAHLGRAAKLTGADAALHRRRAGIAFMRVAIEAPEHPLTAECLFRAAEACRDEGRPDRAMFLLIELIQTRPQAAPWAQRAREMLAKLRGPAGEPVP